MNLTKEAIKNGRSTSVGSDFGLTVRATRNISELKELATKLDEQHYLGSFQPVGYTLAQVIEEGGAAVGLLLWASSAYKLQGRDKWIGWDPLTCAKRRNLVVNNVRFLVFAEARRPNLASQCLGAALRVLKEQWQENFGFQPILAETFTDPETHAGTCYKAAGWTNVAKTAGFKRDYCDFYVPNDRPKRLWIKPLFDDAQQRLCAQRLAPEHQQGETVGAGARSPLNQAQLLSLSDVLLGLKDPRRANGRRFPMHSVLTVVCMGILMGCKHLSEIVRLGNLLDQKQRGNIGFRRKNGAKGFRPMASYSVFREILMRMSHEELAERLTLWLGGQRGMLPATLAMDGKVIRQNLGMIVTILDVETKLPVAVAATTDKGGESDCARKLLESKEVCLINSTLVADALHANHENAHQIVQEKGGNYIAAVKGNQPLLQKICIRELSHSTNFSSPLFSASNVTVA